MTTAEATAAKATAVPTDITKDKDCPEEYHPDLGPDQDFGEGPITTIATFALVAIPLALLSYWASPDSQPQ
jgi:hypothetical protein